MADETVRNSYNDPNWRDDADNPTAHDDVQHGIDDNPTGDAEKGAALGGVGGAVTGAAAGMVAGPGGAVLGAVIGGVAGAVASGLAVGAVDKVDNDNTVSGIGGGTTPERDTTVDTYDNTEPTLRRSWDTTDTTVGATASRFEDYDSDFRNDWQTNYASSGYSYDDYQPAYRYGYDLSSDARYQNRNWADIENDVRTDWETQRPGTWSQYRNSIQHGWERSMGGNGVPGIQTGGYNADGSPDSRGIMEKASDTVTGDIYDDKTGKRVA